MQDQTASRTALGTAYLRAAHQILDSKPLLFPDPIAMTLLGPNAADNIQTAIARHQGPYKRALRSHVCLRARFAEDKLAVAQGATCYVLVGAGFDTFALRQPEWARRLRIVEVDHPATQAAKRDAIAAAGLPLPENLSFAAADFTRETLGDILARQKIEAEDHVYFSWLGVSMYLEEGVIDATLSAMACAANLSEVCLTFKQPPDDTVPGESKMAEFVAGLGESFVSFFTADQMAAKLRQHEFTTQDFLTPDNARDAYYTPLRTNLPAPRHTTICHART